MDKLLWGSRVYLAGPIDRAIDFTSWRNDIKEELRRLGLIILDPCDKPIKGETESTDFIQQKREWKKARKFDKIRAYRHIRNHDLRLCDSADLAVIKLDMSERPFGTIEEIVTMNRSKKPVLVWLPEGLENCPDWLMWMLPEEMLFESKDDLLTYLSLIDKGERSHDRFVFFDHEKLTN